LNGFFYAHNNNNNYFNIYRLINIKEFFFWKVKKENYGRQ